MATLGKSASFPLSTSNNQAVTLKFKNQTYQFDDQNGIREVKTQSNQRKNYLYCLNCNKKGHNCKNCRFPTNSYGCVFFKEFDDKKLRFLMIQRKYTPVYIELLRAKYYDNWSSSDDKKSIINHKYLSLLISDLPSTERYYLTKYDFDYLWQNLWRWVGTDEQMQSIYEEYDNCKNKFKLLTKGFEDQQHGFLSFSSLFDKYPATRTEPDWEFPKGRRDEGESDQQCAIRECKEETTLESSDYKLYLHVKPFQEKFMGINQIKYCNSYYLAEVTNNDKLIYYDPSHTEQNKEIRKIGWYTEEEITQIVNPGYKYRLKMISDINHLITNIKKV